MRWELNGGLGSSVSHRWRSSSGCGDPLADAGRLGRHAKVIAPKREARGRTVPKRFDGMSRINGRTYELTRLDFTVPFDQTERWRFTTNGNAPHRSMSPDAWSL